MPENIDPFLCDIIIYAFAKLEGDRLDSMEINDLGENSRPGMYERTLNLKKINPDLKILISTGGKFLMTFIFHKFKILLITFQGWNIGSGSFSVMANDNQMRKNFVKNAREFIQLHGFDGLDLK